MFELVRMLGSEEVSIVVETRERSRIPNSQAPAPDARAVAVFARLLQTHPTWELRKAACGYYNCFGHVWAARRTAIYEQSGVELIVRDDGYRFLASGEPPLHGDVAVYEDANHDSILHVGFVCELRRLSDPQGRPAGQPAIWVLSKWNDSAGEVLHHLNDVPWAADRFRVRFWTDRE